MRRSQEVWRGPMSSDGRKGGNGGPEGGVTERGEAKRRIEDAAVRLFARRGFVSSSVREIAEAAGVTKPTVYYYFGSKVGLGLAIVEEAQRKVEDYIAEETGGKTDVVERLVGFAMAHYRGCSENRDLAQFLYGLSFSPVESDLTLDVRRFRKGAMDALDRILDDAVAEGVIRPEAREEAHLLFMGSVNIHMMASLRFDLELSRELAERSVRLFLEGVGTRVGED